MTQHTQLTEAEHHRTRAQYNRNQCDQEPIPLATYRRWNEICGPSAGALRARMRFELKRQRRGPFQGGHETRSTNDGIAYTPPDKRTANPLHGRIRKHLEARGTHSSKTTKPTAWRNEPTRPDNALHKTSLLARSRQHIHPCAKVPGATRQSTIATWANNGYEPTMA